MTWAKLLPGGNKLPGRERKIKLLLSESRRWGAEENCGDRKDAGLHCWLFLGLWLWYLVEFFLMLPSESTIPSIVLRSKNKSKNQKIRARRSCGLGGREDLGKNDEQVVVVVIKGFLDYAGGWWLRNNEKRK